MGTGGPAFLLSIRSVAPPGLVPIWGLDTRGSRPGLNSDAAPRLTSPVI